MTDNDEFVRMYVQAVERHHAAYDDLLLVIANGGTALDVVREIVRHLDGMDVLGDWDLDALRRTWEVAGGDPDEFPVVTLVLGNQIPLGETR